jgi:uncharacterized protein YgfB (UPF0149 family)
MNVPDLPDFRRVLESSQGMLDVADLAECHGVLCGMICRRNELTLTDYLDQLLALQLVHDPSPGFRADLMDVFETTNSQLADEDMGFRLWLPDDDQTLDERTISLAQWCTGLLAAFSDGEDLEKLSGEAAEALEDISQIAKAGISADEDSEEDEIAFVEIVEYVRVITLMLREEFRGPGEDDFIH